MDKITLEKYVKSLEFEKQIANILLTSPEDIVYTELLDKIREKFNCAFGYFGYIDKNGDLICPSLTKDIWEKCRVSDKSIRFPKENWDGIWGDSLNNKRSVIKKDNLKIPPGHVQIKQAIAVPIIYKNKIIGQIGLADKASDFTNNDLKSLEEITEFLAPILKIRVEKLYLEENNEKNINYLTKQTELLNNAEKLGKIGGWEYDVKNQKVFWTEETIKIHGLIGKKDKIDTKTAIKKSLSCYNPKYRKNVLGAFEQCIKDGTPYDIEADFTDFNGQKKRIRTLAKAKIENGKVSRVIGNIIDITDQKIQQEKALVLKEKLQTTLNGLSANIALVNEAGKIKYVNNAWKDFAEKNGVSANLVSEDINYLEVCDNIKGESGKEARKFANGLRKVISGKLKNFQMEYSCDSPEEERWFIGRVTNYRNDDSNSIIITHENVTELKKAESKLIKSEEKQRSIFNTAPIGIGVTVDRTFIELNNTFVDMLGYEREELIGKNSNIIYPSEKEYSWVGKEKYRQIEKYGVGKVTTNFVKKDGTIIWISLQSSPISAQDRSKGIIFTAEDVTEKIKLEEGLKRSESKFKSTFNYAPLAIILANDNGEIIDVNEQFSSLFGYSKEEILGKRTIELTFEEDKKETEAVYKKIFKNEINLTDIEKRYVCKSGEIIWGNVNLRSVEDQNGYHLYNISIIENVTEKKQAKEKLKTSEDKFYKAFHRNPGIAGLTEIKTGIFVEINKTFCNTLGFTEDEVIGRKATEILGIDEKSTNETNELIAKYGYIKDLERTIYKKNGTPITVLFSAEKLKIDGKNYLYSVGINITDRKKYEDKLQVFSKAVDQSQVSIVITDIDGNIEYVNSKFTEVTQYTLEEVKGKKTSVLKSGEMSEKFYKNLWETIKSGSEWSGIFHNKKKDGELFWESAIISPIKNEKNEISHFVALKEDITNKVLAEAELDKYKNNLKEIVKERTKSLENEIQRRKKAEDKVKASLKKEKEVNKLKSQFISTVSHEFRTPLTSIYSSVELIERYGHKWGDNKKSNHYIRIKSSIEHLTGMLEEILQLNRVETSKIKFNPQPLDLYNFCKTVIDEINPLLSSIQTLHFAYEVSKCNYLLDENLLRIILSNLLSNAIKYSPDGGNIDFIVTEKGPEFIFRVKDKGLGISKEDLKNIYTPFYRSSHISTISGSGLGLSISKEYAALQNGRLCAKSILGKGSTFELLLKKTNINIIE